MATAEYSPTDDIAQLQHYQQQYIDQNKDELRDLPHPDIYWNSLDIEVEQQKLVTLQRKGIIEKAGDEETEVGKIAYYHVRWPAHMYMHY
jgi:hypothetical protein